MTGRLLVHVLDKDGRAVAAKFSTCLLRYLDSSVPDCLRVHYELKDDRLILTLAKEGDGIMLRHAHYCPVKMLTVDLEKALPRGIIERGINVGAVALAESRDHHMLVTRRAAHMRTFPGVWVPPGGGVSPGESLLETALRELEEEVGLRVDSEIVRSHALCLWESVYPALLEWGPPQRHHIVVYFHLLLDKDHSELSKRTVLQLDEVDAAVWLSQSQVDVIVNAREISNDVEKTFVMKTLDDDGVMHDIHCPVDALLTKVNKENIDESRISSGTRFALSEWLLKCSTNTKL